MSYISVGFAGLTAILFLLYYCIPKRWKRGRECVLLLGSLLFFGSYDFRYLGFLLFTAGSAFICARRMAGTKHKKGLLSVFIISNALIWYVVKVLPWNIGFVQSLLGREADTGLGLLVPLGISYYTLQTIAYVVDIYRGKTEPEKDLIRFLLFVSYFPAIVQGPISRYDELMPELCNRERFSLETVFRGMLLLLIGLVKKLVIADRLAVFVAVCFREYQNMGGLILYLGAVAYAVQIYADFSGCVDLCRGVSLLFNIKLINNFNRPYLAKSIRDFWSRWHISLTRWLRDYIYIPLGGNRKGTLRKYLNILITFLISGIWHGAGFNFMVWGLLHAGYQIIGRSTAGLRAKCKRAIGIREGSLSERIYQTIITFNLVTFAWIFFRADSVGNALGYIGAMFTNQNNAMLFNGGIFTLGISRTYVEILVLNVLALLLIDLISRDQDSAIDGVFAQHIFIRWGVYILLILDLFLFGAIGSGYNISGFMYGGF